MTYEYKIINGKLIINGDDGLQERDNVENLEDILKLENKRDILEREIEKIKAQRDKFKSEPMKSKTRRILGIVLRTLGITAFVALLAVLFSQVFYGDFNAIEHLMEGASSQIFGICVVCESTGLLFQFFFERLKWVLAKEREQNALSCDITLECLENDLKQVLSELQRCINDNVKKPDQLEICSGSLATFNDGYQKVVDAKSQRLMNLLYARNELLKLFDILDEPDTYTRKGYDASEIEVAKKLIMEEKNKANRSLSNR